MRDEGKDALPSALLLPPHPPNHTFSQARLDRRREEHSQFEGRARAARAPLIVLVRLPPSASSHSPGELRSVSPSHSCQARSSAREGPREGVRCAVSRPQRVTDRPSPFQQLRPAPALLSRRRKLTHPPQLSSSQNGAVMSAPAPAREPHLVSLKVLRAARPSLVHSTTPFSSSPAIAELDRASVTDGGGAYGQDQILSGALMLPSTLGTIYLGSVPFPYRRTESLGRLV